MNEAHQIFEDELAAWQEQVEAARLEKEQLAPLVAEKAKTYAGMTLEQLMARWAEVMGSQRQWSSLDDFKVEVMALYQAVGSNAGKRFEALRMGGFDFGERVQ